MSGGMLHGSLLRIPVDVRGAYDERTTDHALTLVQVQPVAF